MACAVRIATSSSCLSSRTRQPTRGIGSRMVLDWTTGATVGHVWVQLPSPAKIIVSNSCGICHPDLAVIYLGFLLVRMEISVVLLLIRCLSSSSAVDCAFTSVGSLPPVWTTSLKYSPHIWRFRIWGTHPSLNFCFYLCLPVGTALWRARDERTCGQI